MAERTAGWHSTAAGTSTCGRGAKKLYTVRPQFPVHRSGLPKSCTPLSGYRLLRPHARCIGTGEAAPEQIEDMSFSASRIKRLPRDVAATIATNLPGSPRHQSSALIKCQIFHIPLGDADVGNILRPMFTVSPSTQPSENQRYLCDTNSRHWN